MPVLNALFVREIDGVELVLTYQLKSFHAYGIRVSMLIRTSFLDAVERRFVVFELFDFAAGGTLENYIVVADTDLVLLEVISKSFQVAYI